MKQTRFPSVLLLRLALVLLSTLVVLGSPALASGPDAPETPDDEATAESTVDSAAPDPLAADNIGVPMRIRDFTFPSHLVLAFAPMPAAPLGNGNWAFEAHFSQVNNFQVSPGVEEYLDSTRAPGERRPLS